VTQFALALIQLALSRDPTGIPVRLPHLRKLGDKALDASGIATWTSGDFENVASTGFDQPERRDSHLECPLLGRFLTRELTARAIATASSACTTHREALRMVMKPVRLGKCIWTSVSNWIDRGYTENIGMPMISSCSVRPEHALGARCRIMTSPVFSDDAVRHFLHDRRYADDAGSRPGPWRLIAQGQKPTQSGHSR